MGYHFPDSYSGLLSHKPALSPTIPAPCSQGLATLFLLSFEFIIASITLSGHASSFLLSDCSLLPFLPSPYSSCKSDLSTIFSTNHLRAAPHKSKQSVILSWGVPQMPFKIFTVFIIFFYHPVWWVSMHKLLHAAVTKMWHFSGLTKLHSILTHTNSFLDPNIKSWRVSPWQLNASPRACHISLLFTAHTPELVAEPCLTPRGRKVKSSQVAGRRGDLDIQEGTRSLCYLFWLWRTFF